MTRLKMWLVSAPVTTAIVVAAAQLFSFSIANADTQGLTPSPITTITGLKDFLCNIAGWFAWFILALSVVMILYAAYTYITAGDDTEKTSKARRTITYAAVGIAVALMANAFPAIVNSVFSTGANGIQTSYCQ